MATTTQITRLQTARNTIRTKLVELGLATATTKLDGLATAVEGIDNRGAVNAQVQEGDTFTIPKGYHNGSGVVAGVKGGGNYSLQEKAVTPTKAQQAVTSDAGYYGLSGVTVNPIPDNFNDTSIVTAGAADVLANKVVVNADGETITGTMPSNGAVSKTLDAKTTSYTVPNGYHNGSGVVKITPESKTITPTKADQTITPTSGKVLTSVLVEAIPAAYQDVTGVTATAADVLDNKYIVTSDGKKIEGAIPVNGAVSGSIDGMTTTSFTIPAGYTTGGTVSLTSDIEDALAEI